MIRFARPEIYNKKKKHPIKFFAIILLMFCLFAPQNSFVTLADTTQDIESEIGNEVGDQL